MANSGGIRILAASFLSCAILPLLASAAFPFLNFPKPVFPKPAFPGHSIDKSPSQEVDGTAPIVKGIGGAIGSFPGFLHPWVRQPGEGGGGGGENENNVKPDKPGQQEPGLVDGTGDGVPQQPEPTPGDQEPVPVTPGALREGFYQQSCPQAEKIVNEIINGNFQKDPTLAPALIRLFFHDCFVTGCDASILLDQTPTGENVEKTAPHNGKFVRGFEVIDEIKARLEAECPGIVSCADILAFANRDSLVFTGVPNYNVPAGRRDGLASLAKNVQGNLPLPQSTAQEMTQLFERKGMSLEEMVVLIGAHSIGTAHCTIVAGRFRDPKKMKDIDRGYLLKMQVMTMCQNETQDLAFDPYSQQKMDSRFYKELLKNRALLESDQNLAKEPNANNIMKKYVDDQNGWLAKFVASVTKLGEVEVLTGNQGEIRKQCRAVN
ncbi:hypothetical protein OROMI_010232 [Orobanche minor]